MEIRIIDDSSVEIKGNIKSLDDYNEIKRVSQSLVSKGADSVNYEILDSFSMVSSVIGYFIKLINIDGVHVSMNVYDERLYALMDQLNLVHLFNVHKK